MRNDAAHDNGSQEEPVSNGMRRAGSPPRTPARWGARAGARAGSAPRTRARWGARTAMVGGLLGVMMLGVMVVPAWPHHSFAMYDQTTTKVMTGKLTRYVPGANHAQLMFEVLDDEGNPAMKD